jgi:hypothetical protein
MSRYPATSPADTEGFTHVRSWCLKVVGGQHQAAAALPTENRTGIHCTGGRVVFGKFLDGFGKISPSPVSVPQAIHPVAICHRDYTNPALIINVEFYCINFITL